MTFDPYQDMLNEFFQEYPEYKEWEDHFVCDFKSLEDLIGYFPDWWEDRYDKYNMSYEEIAHEWREHNNCLIIDFKDRWLLFAGVEA